MERRSARGKQPAWRARRRFPTAHELVYDNYNFFVIGYSPTERPGDVVVSITARMNAVGLCFIHGAKLPDSKKLLLGPGTQTRFIRSIAAKQRPRQRPASGARS